MSGEKELIRGNIQKEAEQIFKNIKPILEENESSLDYVLKVTIFLKDMNNFQAVNNVYSKYFTGNVLLSCSCIEVFALSMNSDIKIGAVAIFKK